MSTALNGSVRPLTSEDAPALQALLEHGGGYTERVEGRAVQPGDAEAILGSRPPSAPEVPPSQHDRPEPHRVDSDGAESDGAEPTGPHVHLLGAFDGKALVGLVQMVTRWPRSETAHIGLLLVDERARGTGIGRLVHEQARARAAQDPQLTTLRLAIVDTNAGAAIPFWHRLGYAPTGEQHPYAAEALSSTARIWERPLRTAASPQPGLHHLELWTADLANSEPGWAWLLGTLGWAGERIEGWESGRIWRHGDGSYLVLEQSPAIVPAPGGEDAARGRMRPGMNHVALTVRDAAALDALRSEAPEHGWRGLFAEQYPYAGGEDHIAWYGENVDGIEVEVVARTA